MVLVRIAYVADLPTPDEVIRSLDDGGEHRARGRRRNGSGRDGGGAAAASQRDAAARPPRRATTRRAAAAARDGGAVRAAPCSRARRAAASPALAINSFAELVALASDKRDIQIKLALERDVRLVRCEDGTLEIALEPGAAKTLVNDLSRKLQHWTGRSLDGGDLARARRSRR